MVKVSKDLIQETGLGVPPGSVLGPFIFRLYTTFQGPIIRHKASSTINKHSATSNAVPGFHSCEEPARNWNLKKALFHSGSSTKLVEVAFIIWLEVSLETSHSKLINEGTSCISIYISLTASGFWYSMDKVQPWTLNLWFKVQSYFIVISICAHVQSEMKHLDHI